AAAARREIDRANRPPKPPPVESKPLREAIGFRTFPNPRKQGNAGLGIAIAYLSRIGVEVAIPLTDTQRYDLIHRPRGGHGAGAGQDDHAEAVELLRGSPEDHRREQEPSQNEAVRPLGLRMAVRRLRRRYGLSDPH